MSDDLLKKTEEQAGGHPDLDQFFDSLVGTKSGEIANTASELHTAVQDYTGVPDRIRQRLAERAKGAPKLSTEPESAVESAADQTPPAFDYHPEDTNVLGDRGEKGMAVEQAGGSKTLETPLETEEKRDEPMSAPEEEKPEDGGKLVKMATINERGEEVKEEDATTPIASFETKDDEREVQDKSEANPHETFWGAKSVLPKEDQPLEDLAAKLKDAPSGNQPSVVAVESTESNPDRPQMKDEPVIEPLIPQLKGAEQLSGQTAEQKTAEQDADKRPEVIGEIEKGGEVAQPDPRITVDQAPKTEEPKNERTEEPKDIETNKPEKDTPRKRWNPFGWLTGGRSDKHAANDVVRESHDVDSARIYKLTHQDKPEELERAA
jgi:hypothetical protein